MWPFLQGNSQYDKWKGVSLGEGFTQTASVL